MLSDNIKAARIKSGLSQEELGGKIHVVRQTVSKWEKGISVPDAELLVALAEALNTDTTTLLGEDSLPAKSPSDLALCTALQNEQLAIQTKRIDNFVAILKKTAIAIVCSITIIWGIWFVHEAFAPKGGHAILIDYVIDNKTEQAQIWLDWHDQSVARGWGFGESIILESDDPEGTDAFRGFLLKPNSAQMLLKAMEVAIESQGGEIVAIKAYDE